MDVVEDNLLLHNNELSSTDSCLAEGEPPQETVNMGHPYQFHSEGPLFLLYNVYPNVMPRALGIQQKDISMLHGNTVSVNQKVMLVVHSFNTELDNE